MANQRRDGLHKLTTGLVRSHLDRDYNAALNLAALANQVVHGQLDRDVKLPAGNPRKTATSGNGYRHGKTQTMSQRRPRERATP